MAGVDESAAEEAKGMARDLLRTLGLTELVLGALAVYWIRLRFGSSLFNIFPSTGHEVLDIALIACAAAFAGQALSILIRAGVALVEYLLIQKLEMLGYYARLETALNEYRTFRGQTGDLGDADRIDLAAHYASRCGPGFRASIENVRAGSELAYSAVLFAVPYGIYFIRSGAPKGFVWFSLLSAPLMLLLGLLRQLEYVNEIEMILRSSLETQTPQAPAAIGTTGG
jgi:hypothetical protein